MKKDIYKIGDICEIKSGKRLPKDTDFADYKTDYPYIRARDIKDGKINTDALVYLEQNVQEKIKRYIINSGDITLTIAGTIGEVGYATPKVDGFNLTENAVRLTSFSSDVNSKYLFYILRQSQYYDYMQVIAGAAAQPKLGIYKVQRIKVELPDVEIQNKIADILSTYDELIENNNKRIAILEQMAENLYKEWFVRFRFPGYETAKFENGLPVGWEIQQAQNIFDITIGRTPDRKQFDYFTNNENDALWVSISDMKDNMFITRSSEYLTDEAINKVNMPMVEADTVLLSFKLSVGRVAITTKLSCTNEAIAHFKTKDKDLLEYTYLYLKLFNYQNLGNTSAIGNAVNSTIIKKMKFVLPDRNLLEMFHNSAKDIFTEIKNLKHSNENLIKQRDLLLPRLMSGKLEV